MRLEAIGRIADPKEIDTEVLELPIIGYTEKDKKEVETVINFVANASVGAVVDMNRAIDAKGNILPLAAIEFVDKCVHEGSRAKWDELLHDPKIMVSQATMIEVYQKLCEVYANRPSLQRPGSRDGASPTKKTSRAAASAKKSTRTNSR